MPSETVAYRPKASMCLACEHTLSNCSSLNFSAMRPMGRDHDGTIVVRCDRFIRPSAAMEAPLDRVI